MKTGICKYGERCKYHHPLDRATPSMSKLQSTVKLTPAGLPRREVCLLFFTFIHVTKWRSICISFPLVNRFCIVKNVHDYLDCYASVVEVLSNYS